MVTELFGPLRLFGGKLVKSDEADRAARFGTAFDVAETAAGDGQGLAIRRERERDCRHVQIRGKGPLQLPSLRVPQDDFRQPLVLLLLEVANGRYRLAVRGEREVLELVSFHARTWFPCLHIPELYRVVACDEVLTE